MKKLSRTVRRGEVIKIGESRVEIVDCDRGRVQVRVVHEEAVKVHITVIEKEKPLQLESAPV